MNVVELIEEAARQRGGAKNLAREMHRDPARLSEWKKGKGKPDTAEIAYMAKAAGLPVLITIALISKDIYPETAQLWDDALGEARAPTYWSRLGADCALC